MIYFNSTLLLLLWSQGKQLVLGAELQNRTKFLAQYFRPHHRCDQIPDSMALARSIPTSVTMRSQTIWYYRQIIIKPVFLNTSRTWNAPKYFTKALKLDSRCLTHRHLGTRRYRLPREFLNGNLSPSRSLSMLSPFRWGGHMTSRQ